MANEVQPLPNEQRGDWRAAELGEVAVHGAGRAKGVQAQGLIYQGLCACFQALIILQRLTQPMRAIYKQGALG